MMHHCIDDKCHHNTNDDCFLFFFILPRREITFENAEELTEEGMPFMILFYHPNNTTPIKDYKAMVEAELIQEKRK